MQCLASKPATNLHELSFSTQLLVLSAWREAKRARQKFSNNFPLGAALETKSGKILTGCQYHALPASPANSHEAIEAALKSSCPSELIVKAAVVGSEWPLNISGGCRDLLWTTSGGSSSFIIFGATIDLQNIKENRLGCLYPHPPTTE